VNRSVSAVPRWTYFWCFVHKIIPLVTYSELGTRGIIFYFLGSGVLGFCRDSGFVQQNVQEGFREHALFLQRTQKNRLFSKPLNSALEKYEEKNSKKRNS